MFQLYRNYIFSLFILVVFSLFQLLTGDFIINQLIFVTNIFVIVAYTFIIFLLLSNKSFPNGITNLYIVVFSYSLLFLVIYKYIYYDHHGDYFSIGAFDEINYSNWAKKLQDLNFVNSIKRIISEYEYSDYGAIIYITILYKITSSTILVNLINTLIGALSAVTLYKLSHFFLPRRIGFICSFTYFCSSFVIQFESTGLKEMLFVYFVLLCIYMYYKYVVLHQRKAIILFTLFSLSILFFRPSVLAFILLSVLIGFILRLKQNITNASLALIIIISSSFLITSIENIFHQFSSFDKSIEIRSDAVVKAGENIAIYAATFSSLFGPLPTFLPVPGKEIQSLFSIGLLFRVLLSVPFWLGARLILFKRHYILYPILFLALFEMVSLLYIMESYELRYHLIHLPFIYLIAFYYINLLSTYPKSIRIRVNLLTNIASIILIIVVIYWNLRIK